MDVYILYSCNEWKSTDSMRVIGVYSCLNTLRKAIKDEIDEDNMECDDIDNLMACSFYDVNKFLEYGFVEKWTLDKGE